MVEFHHSFPVLYKHMFRVEENPSIAFIGCAEPVGCMFSVGELQARLATRVFKGLVKLPSVKEMQRDIAENLTMKESETYDVKTHATSVRHYQRVDTIKREMFSQKSVRRSSVIRQHSSWAPCS